MMDLDASGLFFRVDLLTGCSNLVSFSRGLTENFDNDTLAPLSLISIDVYQLRDINRSKGFEFGDSILRWIGIAIKDETGATVYRISGDNFAAVLIGDSHEAHQETARKLFERLNGEALQLALTPPVVRMVVIHFPAGARLHPAVVWKNLNEQLEMTSAEQPLCVVHADTREENSAALHAVELMAKRIGTLGSTLQYAFRLAYTDPLTHSPNMLAIQRKLDLALSEAMLEQSPLSVCLMDGDNLKRYNNQGYQAGDEVIRRISMTLSQALRPDDFLGRWRMGDEFIVILPATGVDQARVVAERLRASVESASRDWLYPTSISIGIAHFPGHGSTTNELLQAAESALVTSKKNGKNRVTVATLAER